MRLLGELAAGRTDGNRRGMVTERFRQDSVSASRHLDFSGILSALNRAYQGVPDDLPALRCHDHD